MTAAASEHQTAAPRRKRLTAADRRASILAAAGEVFAETGYKQGKVSDVAARLGVSEPVVFQNFGSKAALYAAVLEHAADDMCAAIRAGVETHGSAVGLLSRMLAPGHLDHVHSRGGPGVLFADAVALTAEPGVEEAARRGVRRVADALADLLAAGQAAGEVRADLDPATGAWWLLTMLASHGFRTAVMPDREHLEAQLGRLTLHLLVVHDGLPVLQGAADRPPKRLRR
jgi:AcrR family transcriptional regulator